MLENSRFKGEMVSVISSNAIYLMLEPRSSQPKTIKFVFVASPLNTQFCVALGLIVF